MRIRLLVPLLLTALVPALNAAADTAHPAAPLPWTSLLPIAEIYGGPIEAAATDGALMVALTRNADPTSWYSPQVFDISDPSAPRALARLPLGGMPGRSIALDGSRAYILSDSGGSGRNTLFVYDLREPDRPVLLGRTVLPVVGYTLAIRRTLAYIGSANELLVFDVADPARPALLGRAAFQPAWPVRRIQLEGDTAYVLTDRAWAFDISDPRRPALRAAAPFPNPNARDLAALGSRVFVAAHDDGLRIFDFGAPTPVLLGTFSGTGPVVAVQVRGATAYVVDNRGLRVLDVSDPASPTVIGELALSGFATEIAIVGTRALLFGDGVQVVDIATPSALTLVGGFQWPREAAAVAVENGIAYLLEGDRRLLTLDVRDPLRPVVLGELDLPAGATAVSAAGGRAYLRLSTSGLLIVDVGDVRRPQLLGTYSTTVFDVAADGTTAYIAAGADGFQVVDFSTPSAPVVRWSYTKTGGYAPVDLEVAGDNAYVAAGTTVSIFSLADPTPALIGELDRATPPSFQWFTAVTAAGDTLYVGAGQVLDDGVIAVDISAPQQPQVTQVVQSSGFPLGMNSVRRAREGLLLAARSTSSDWGEIAALTLDEAGNVRQVETTSACGAGVVDVEGERLYIAGRGLCIVDLRQVQPVVFLPTVRHVR